MSQSFQSKTKFVFGLIIIFTSGTFAQHSAYWNQ